MSHRVNVDLIGDQEILVAGELVNIHDIKRAIVDGEGRIVEVIKHEKPKRCPDAAGVLVLTKEELEEFDGFMPFIFPEKLSHIQIIAAVYEKNKYGFPSRTYIIDNYEAIEWLIRRFNLRRKK
jgi:hypothetical protein